jgi:hypothetical protein
LAAVGGVVNATTTVNAPGAPPTYASMANWVIGYYQTRGDWRGTQPNILVSGRVDVSIGAKVPR